MRNLGFNGEGVLAIYRFEMARATRTLWQSLVTPVITTALYFVVFGAAIGGRMADMDGISFGAFIVPGLTLLSVFMQSIFNASFGIYFPKFTGTIYELLSAPISSLEVVLAYLFDANAEKTGVPSLLRRVSDLGIGFKDLATEQSSLEDIFVGLVHDGGRGARA